MLSPMHVVAVLSEKGGTGKTTVAVHLAVASKLAGLDAVIIDLDPQASAADWADRRESSPEAVAIPPARLAKLLADLRANEVQLVFVDTGRDSNNAGYTAAQAADLVLIPCQPSGFDFRALTRTTDLCKLAGKRPFVILNGLQPGATKAEADAREALITYECDLAPVALHRRAAYRQASIVSRTAQETEPGSPAAEETEQLYHWVAQQLSLSPTQQHTKQAI
jgi:chromosome partitioning protein